MKSFSLLKISAMFALGFGATLILAPSGRAQAEVAPDHYDATESPAAPAKKALQAHRKQASAVVSREQGKADSVVTLSSATAQNSPAAQRRALVAVQDKRKAASSNSQPR
ncbi:MAG TPA: hypothetical protein VEU31_09840 [Candidatus Acidoferrales bacterium]|nr:hypothetical protein [Candidatus Acidoferrales bacterium]